MWTFICGHLHVYMWTFTCLHMDVYMFTYGRLHVYMWTFTCLHMDVYMFTCGRLHVYTWTFTCLHVDVYMFTCGRLHVIGIKPEHLQLYLLYCGINMHHLLQHSMFYYCRHFIFPYLPNASDYFHTGSVNPHPLYSSDYIALAQVLTVVHSHGEFVLFE